MGELDPDVAWLRGKPGTKWAAAGDGVLPAWIADMDFAAPPPVREALARLVDGGDLGYPAWLHEGSPLRAEFARRMRTRYGWSPDPAHVREFADIIQALQAVLHVATAPGDAVALHVPAYPPFLNTMGDMGRTLVPIPVTRNDSGAWGFDAEAFERSVEERGVRALALVNPHNPTGRVFTRAELTAMADVARRHDLIVVSDEIHADLVYDTHAHIPFASLSDNAASRTVTLTSATKAFNIAGVRCAVAHVGSERVRDGFAACPPFLFGDPNLPGVVATMAAWRDGDEWLSAARARLDANRAILVEALRPAGIAVDPPEATYLAWLDCRGLGLDTDPAAYFLEKAKVKLSPGPDFGEPGTGYARLNFATSEPVLREICTRITGSLAAG
jgi:cystathionine beta-lyase